MNYFLVYQEIKFLFACLIQKRYFKKCSNFQFPDRFENDLNFNVIKNLLYNNIKTFEKDNRILISNGILTIQSKN